MQSKHQNRQNTLKIHFPILLQKSNLENRKTSRLPLSSATPERANKTEKGIPELLVQLDFPRWNSFGAESDWNSQHIGFVWKISRGILCQPAAYKVH